MPSATHGRGGLTDLPEDHSTTENGGTQTHYCIVQHRTMVGEKRETNWGLGACQSSWMEIRFV